MKKLIAVLFACCISLSSTTAQDGVPEVSKAPLAAMELLKPLAGDWTMTSEYSADDGKTWQKGEPEAVKLNYRQKGMLLQEVPNNIHKPGFHTEFYVGYDQYRKLYRVFVVDDTWGLPDIYEGDVDDGKLVVTNLKSGTFFPIGPDTWRAFRLTIELGSQTRTMLVDKSDDMGKTWQPNFRISYVKK